jgi:hypothetical protein
MDPSKRREIAIWRLNILGPLVIARLHREARKVRNDGTVRWGGGFY